MLLRSSFIALSLGLFACSFDSPAPIGSTESEQTSHEAGDDDADDDVPAGTSQNALDGTWDITATGNLNAVSAMMTIKGGHVTGAIVLPGEGEEDSGCIVDTNRWHFEIDVIGDHLSGSYGRDTAWSGERASCSGRDFEKRYTFTGARTHAEANANAETPVEGEWTFKTEDGEERTAMTVAGLAAQLYGAKDPHRTGSITTSGSTTSLKSTGPSKAFVFAARKR